MNENYTMNTAQRHTQFWKEYTTREFGRRFLLGTRVFFAALITVDVVIFVLYLPLFTLTSKLGTEK